MDEEIGKYRKRTESNVSESKRKSKHKHQYQPCLLKECTGGRFSNRLYLASYCSLCGKIDNVWFFGELENEEYKDYPIFEVDSVFQKFVCLKVGEKSE